MVKTKYETGERSCVFMAGTRRGNGEGSITQRSNGKWEARISLAGGKRKSFYGKTRQEAHGKLTKALRDRDKGALIITDERLTVETYLTRWLADMRPPRLRYSTYLRYTQLLAHVIRAYGDVRLTRLTAPQLKALYARLQWPSSEKDGKESDGNARSQAKSLARPLSASSVHHIHTVLRQALGDAVKLGVLPNNVTDRIDAPPLRRAVIQPFTAEEAQRLLDAAQGERLEALYVVAVNTGMRLGELLALTWRQVDMERKTLHVVASLQRAPGCGTDAWAIGEPKTTRSRRQIALTPTAVEALHAHRVRQLTERLALADVWQDHDLVFCDQSGRHLSLQGVTRYEYHRLLRRAGLPQRRFHDLRHTTATLLLKAGIPLKVVSEVLGHTTIALTADTYSHVTPDMQREAAGALEALLAPSRH